MMIRFFQWLCQRGPDKVICNEYLHRWHVIPRNPFFNIYLHEFVGSDDGRAVHDHPWINLTWVLSGQYDEVMETDTFIPDTNDMSFGEQIQGRRMYKVKRRRKWNLVFRRPTAMHMITGVQPNTWTLFITGPRIRKWGFREGVVGWRPFDAKD